MLNKEIMVVDLECTCDERGDNSQVKREDMEIIEIGAVISDLIGNIKDEKLEIFVKPTINPILTSFCTNLTTITQDMIEEEGISLIDAILKLNEYALKHKVTTWGAWGYFDNNQLKREVELKGINVSDLYFFNNMKFVNLSLLYKEARGFKKKKGIGKALLNEKLEFIGVRHRAVYDSLNTARIIGSVNKSGVKTII